MKIYLGADHQGFYLKEKVYDYLNKRNFAVEDVGNSALDPSDDFPQFAQAAAGRVLQDPNISRAILICGGGQGMAMAANRFKGIRASVIWDSHEAKMTRHDNDSNVLCLPSRILDKDDDWKDIIDTWLATPYAGAARFKRRNAELDEFNG